MRLTPVSEKNYTDVRYGIITPDGKIYQCGFTDHGELVARLETAGKLPRIDRDYNGSVHISDYEFDKIVNARNPNMGSYYEDALTVTQKQLDVMMDYLVANNLQFDLSGLNVI